MNNEDLIGKVVVIGSGPSGAKFAQQRADELGKEVLVVSKKEAKEYGLINGQEIGSPVMKLEARPVLPITVERVDQSGQQKRRERRKKKNRK